MIEIKNSVLLIIDVQGKLAHKMHDAGYLPAIQGLIKAAQLLDIPILVTEQAPEKIGSTISDLTEIWGDVTPIVKHSFSCCGEPVFMDAFKLLNRSHVIVAGIESHVCVYQTVRDLLKAKYHVALVTDAVSARSEHNGQAGIQRCKDEGAVLTTLEMLVTELIVSTGHPRFREIMALLKDNT